MQINDKKLAYVGDLPAFGPPIYDETGWQYRKRVFWRGASWGGFLSLIVTS